MPPRTDYMRDYQNHRYRDDPEYRERRKREARDYYRKHAEQRRAYARKHYHRLRQRLAQLEREVAELRSQEDERND